MLLRDLCTSLARTISAITDPSFGGKASPDSLPTVVAALCEREFLPADLISTLLRGEFLRSMALLQQLAQLLDQGTLIRGISLLTVDKIEVQVHLRFKDAAEARQLVAGLCFLRLKARVLRHEAEIPLGRLIQPSYFFCYGKLIGEMHFYVVSLRGALNFLNFRRATRGSSAWEEWELRDRQIDFYEHVLLTLLGLEITLCAELHLLQLEEAAELVRLGESVEAINAEMVHLTKLLFKKGSVVKRFTLYSDRAQQAILLQVRNWREGNVGQRLRALRSVGRTLVELSPGFAEFECLIEQRLRATPGMEDFRRRASNRYSLVAPVEAIFALRAEEYSSHRGNDHTFPDKQ